MSQIVVVNQESFDDEVLKATEPVLVDMWASWCGPCKMLGPIVDEVAAEGEGFKVAKIDVDENGDLAAAYKVSSIPTLLVFKDGEVVNRSLGLISKEEVKALIDAVV